MSREMKPQAAAATAERAYERQDMNPPTIALILLGLLVTVVIVFLVVAWLFGVFQSDVARRDVPPSPLAEKPMTPPGPILQVAPQQDLQAMRSEEEARLHSYGWTNRNAGTVRIPIDRAMKLLLERGLPKPGPQTGK